MTFRFLSIVIISLSCSLFGGCFATSITNERSTKISALSETEAIGIVSKYYGAEWAKRPTLKAGVGDATCNDGAGKTIEVPYKEMTVWWSSNALATYGDAPAGFPHGISIRGPATAGFWCGTVYQDYRYFRTLEIRDSFVDALVRLGAKVKVN